MSMTPLSAKVAALQQAETYPELPERIDAIETHKSWVFLTALHAYKLKKPIRLNSVDHRNLPARWANCLEEVRLNRRLAGDVYLGVVPLTLDDSGRIRLDGQGVVIDWLVKMRRLPAGRMLNGMIEEDQVTAVDARRMARLLAGFYRDAPPVDISAREYRSGIARELSISSAAFTPAIEHTIGIEGAAIVRALADRLSERAGLFDERVSAGYIVEGHGDLRPEHICLIDSEPVVIDCLEFDRQLRIVDPLDELGFLAMECERRDAGWIGPVLLGEYERLTGDRGPAELVSFYKAYRATSWARLAVWRLREDGVADPEKWAGRARCYLELAERHAR